MEREHIAREDKPCPAVKRDGEVCGSTRVSVSGYCFAHDPESSEWRAMGSRANSQRRRAARRLKEAGLGHLVKKMEGSLDDLRLGKVSSSDVQAMARVTDTIFRMVKWAEDDVKQDDSFSWPTKWEAY